MCGIFGKFSYSGVSINEIVDGVSRLAYRGYDSCGIAIIEESGKLQCFKAIGGVENLKLSHETCSLIGNVGIGHTRWATHGKVNEVNAHPVHSGRVYLVHNGIISNYIQIKQYLKAFGIQFYGDTDSEVLAALIDTLISSGMAYEEAFCEALKKADGDYAVVCIFENEPNLMLCAKRNKPLMVCKAENASGVINFTVTSDFVTAKKEDGFLLNIPEETFCVISDKNFKLFNLSMIPMEIKFVKYDSSIVTKYDSIGLYENFMLKEIFDQPSVLRNIFNNRGLNSGFHIPNELNEVEHIVLVGCGSSYFACLTAAHWFSSICKVTVSVEVASEFNPSFFYKKSKPVCMFISQSGETADTLIALDKAKQIGCFCIGIVNRERSIIEEKAHCIFRCDAGLEMSVAATKTFTAQLAVLFNLALSMPRHVVDIEYTCISDDLCLLPDIISRSIESIMSDVESKIDDCLKYSGFLVIGRGISVPIAKEGALKLRELSYSFAIGMEAGELKHGSLALIDETVLTIVIAPFDSTFQKIVSGVQEILSRGGDVLIITDERGILEFVAHCRDYYIPKFIKIPSSSELTSPFFTVLVMQFFAYFKSVKSGLNVDRPRNLAKSVTVE